MSVVEMFKVVYTIDENGCWIWPAVDKDGYGHIKREGRKWRAHRWFYTQYKGPIPHGMTVDHLCFVPLCVNPEHLRLLTHQENSSNVRRKFKTHCVNGHEYTPENTYGRPAGRACNTCRARVASEWHKRQVDCPQCGLTLTAGSLNRHLRRMHSEPDERDGAS